MDSFLKEAYNNCTIRYGDLKKQLAEDMVKFITPIREKVECHSDNEKYLQKVMEKGAEKARASAAEHHGSGKGSYWLNYY